MSSILEIVRKNRDTYYDFSTGEKSSILRSFVIKMLAAILFAYLFPTFSGNFLNSIITVYAVLTGFSFNILFYLLSINRTKSDGKQDSLESQIKVKKVNKLTDELFYNISYFNISAIFVIITTLTFFLFDSRATGFFAQFGGIGIIHSYMGEMSPYLKETRNFILYGYRGFFYFLLLESLHAFFRTIARVSYYFREKINLVK